MSQIHLWLVYLIIYIENLLDLYYLDILNGDLILMQFAQLDYLKFHPTFIIASFSITIIGFSCELPYWITHVSISKCQEFIQTIPLSF